VVLAPSLGSTRSVLVTGRVLRERVPLEGSPLSRNLRNLFAPTWRGAPVHVFALGRQTEVRSVQRGKFEWELKSDPEAPFVPGVYPVIAHVAGERVRSTVQVISDQAPFVVLSDFDDTVAQSHVLDKPRLIANALLKDGRTQDAVPGMSNWYRCLLGEKSSVPGLAFVSGSPVQFQWRVATFLRLNQFPPAALYLRTLTLSTLHGYKEPVFERLLETVRNPVLLVGDSGEKDPEIYAELSRRHPERIVRIYIRDAGRTEDASRFKGMVLFKEASQAALDSLERGYISSACYEREFPLVAAPR